MVGDSCSEMHVYDSLLWTNQNRKWVLCGRYANHIMHGSPTSCRLGTYPLDRTSVLGLSSRDNLSRNVVLAYAQVHAISLRGHFCLEVSKSIYDRLRFRLVLFCCHRSGPTWVLKRIDRRHKVTNNSRQLRRRWRKTAVEFWNAAAENAPYGVFYGPSWRAIDRFEIGINAEVCRLARILGREG